MSAFNSSTAHTHEILCPLVPGSTACPAEHQPRMSSQLPPRPLVGKDEIRQAWDGSPEGKVNTYSESFPLDFSGSGAASSSSSTAMFRDGQYRGPSARPLSAAAMDYERVYQEGLQGNGNRASAPVSSQFRSTHVGFPPQRTSLPQRKAGDPFGPVESMASLVRSPNPNGQPLAPARSAQEFFTPSQVEMISGVRTSTRSEWEGAMRGRETYTGYERDGGRHHLVQEGAIDYHPGHVRYQNPVTYLSTTQVHRQSVRVPFQHFSLLGPPTHPHKQHKPPRHRPTRNHHISLNSLVEAAAASEQRQHHA